MQACPICLGAAGTPFLELSAVPVHVNVLHRSAADAATIPRGDLRLVFCAGCGLIWNASFDERLVEYDAEYENSLHASPTFAAYAESLAEHLVQRFDLAGRRVAELGCGQGDFLQLLCRAGAAHGLGLDPSFTGTTPDERVAVRRELFDGAPLGADFVCCRHVLEHIRRPVEFVRSLRRALPPGVPVYFEVPNGAFQLEHGVVWDLIYAHVTTFTAPSLATLFELCGFEQLEVGTSFGGQYLWVEARAGEGRPVPRAGEVAELGRLVDRFAAGYRSAIAGWDERARAFAGAGRRAALWGAGAKGVTFLNALGSGACVDVAVDLNPRKQGTFVTGTGQPIVAPEQLAGYAPDVVLVANPIYADEVREWLAGLGVRPEVVVV
jgi:SAM-dependent methyltransferase